MEEGKYWRSSRDDGGRDVSKGGKVLEEQVEEGMLVKECRWKRRESLEEE